MRSEPAEIVLPDRNMSFEEFLAWAETIPRETGRFELRSGRAIAKKGLAGTKNAEQAKYREMKTGLYRALYAAVAASGIEAHAVGEGPTVPLASCGRNAEPDALVYLGSKVPRDSHVVPEPVIVCVVLLPSTAKHDMSARHEFSAKLEGCLAISSVRHYIIADPDRPMLIVHSRGSGNSHTNRLVSDPAAVLSLDPPGLRVSVAEVLGG